jgi:hypothetical protein
MRYVNEDIPPPLSNVGTVFVHINFLGSSLTAGEWVKTCQNTVAAKEIRVLGGGGGSEGR